MTYIQPQISHLATCIYNRKGNILSSCNRELFLTYELDLRMLPRYGQVEPIR